MLWNFGTIVWQVLQFRFWAIQWKTSFSHRNSWCWWFTWSLRSSRNSRTERECGTSRWAWRKRRHRIKRSSWDHWIIGFSLHTLGTEVLRWQCHYYLPRFVSFVSYIADFTHKLLMGTFKCWNLLSIMSVMSYFQIIILNTAARQCWIQVYWENSW